MRKEFLGFLLVLPLLLTACPGHKDVVANPWLVPFQERTGSALSRSQMRAMVRLAGIYKTTGMEAEYRGSMITAVEIFAGDRDVTFELLNHLIDRINQTRMLVATTKQTLVSFGIDPATLSRENLKGVPSNPYVDMYLSTVDELKAQYEECHLMLANACWQIPYDPELYYRMASLQYIRAAESNDRTLYKDAVNYLKRGIASDSGHLESYHLIALTYEKLGDKQRAIRFWQLFETIYEIAPQVMGAGFITPEREQMHREALEHLAALGAPQAD